MHGLTNYNEHLIPDPILDDNGVREIIGEAFSDIPTRRQFKSATKGIYIALCQRSAELDDSTAENAVAIYRFFRDSTEDPNQINNYSNNVLLGNVAISAAQTGNLDLWRFVCLPKLSLEVSDQREYARWKYDFSNHRYDTLKPVLPFDQRLIEGFRSFNINPSLTLVLDDLEAPYLRTTNHRKSGFSGYESLKKPEQARALAGLVEMRTSIRDWISESTQNLNCEANVIFFSEMVEYSTFADLLATFELEVDERHTKILNQEMQLVREIFPQISYLECRIYAIRRIAQYAVEGAILYPRVSSGVYLASEYPVNLVWKKLTLLADIPTLFYLQDKDVRNL